MSDESKTEAAVKRLIARYIDEARRERRREHGHEHFTLLLAETVTSATVS